MRWRERRKNWFRDLDSNQDTQLQRLMSYRLDDPGMAEEIVAEGCKHAQAAEMGSEKLPVDMAERVGFEPTVGFLLHTLSKRAP